MSDEEMESLLQDDAIRRAHEEYNKVIEDPQERRWAWARQVYQMDRTGELNEARREGRAEGLEEGRSEGAHGQAIETAWRLLAMGLSAAEVAEGTGLPLHEVEGLSASE